MNFLLGFCLVFNRRW